MSHRITVRATLLVVSALAMQACATKGFVRREVATSRAALDSAIVAEQNARIAADNDLASRIAGLRVEFDTLRTQFGARIAATEDALRFAMPVTFAYDDATVRSEYRPLLERFARVAQRFYPNSTITVEGFADPAGSQAYNIGLSRQRAQNVMDALVSVGLAGNPLRAIGYGESRQVNPGAAASDPGAEANRRVVFVIESAGPEGMIALAPSGR
jgi:outer membrane protein OmpA-like peptidoglycan-associated protein